jgi:sugar diacid utilization regulator
VGSNKARGTTAVARDRPADTAASTGSGGQSDSRLQTWLTEVAQAAATDAHTPAELLGAYLDILADAALSGRRPEREELMAVRTLGQRAAEQGIGADQAVDLYLSAAWRMWQQIPRLLPTPRKREQIRDAAEAVLRVSADAVEILVEGHQAARRQRIRQEESTRREFVDDLLRGDTDVARLVERAEPFGLDLGRSHQLLLAAGANSTAALESAAVTMERIIVDRYGDREVLIATKDDLLVVLLPGELTDPAAAAGIVEPATDLHTQLRRHTRGSPWQVAAGRAYPGAYGIARSYEEAREALHLARRLHLTDAVLHPHEMLVYRILGRDQSALADLVHTVLHPLTRARGGAEPLLHTLRTYFATGTVATATARHLHLSVRAVTYRLDRIHALTGHNPLDPADHLTLHMAATGAQLLDWPTTPLPGPRRP